MEIKQSLINYNTNTLNQLSRNRSTTDFPEKELEKRLRLNKLNIRLNHHI